MRRNVIKTLVTRALQQRSFGHSGNIANASDILPLPPKKRRAAGSTENHFVYDCVVHAVGGKGGDGAVSFSAAWCRPHDGPDGGEGGHGGHVIFTADGTSRSLAHIKRRCFASPGENGRNKNCYGASAEHLTLPVPVGTVFRDLLSGEIVAELFQPDQTFIAARGGSGGHGNRFYLSNEHRAPNYAQEGALGEDKRYHAELKVMAQLGLIGFPSAGKSTFLRAISRARPKVSAYPFTTLQPHVGIVEYEDYVQLAIADIPGLVPGSHNDEGLGIDFLRHVDRCAFLAYIIDLSLSDDSWKQIDLLRYELESFSKGLSERSQFVLANKIDHPESEKRLNILRSKTSLPIFPMSAKYNKGTTDVLVALRRMCDAHNVLPVVESKRTHKAKLVGL